MQEIIDPLKQEWLKVFFLLWIELDLGFQINLMTPRPNVVSMSLFSDLLMSYLLNMGEGGAKIWEKNVDIWNGWPLTGFSILLDK